MAFEKSGSSVGEEREVTDLLEPVDEVTQICQTMAFNKDEGGERTVGTDINEKEVTFQNWLHTAIESALKDEDYEAGFKFQEARKILRLYRLERAEIIRMMSECERNIIVDICDMNVQIINDTLVDIWRELGAILMKK